MQIIRVPGWHTKRVPPDDEPDAGPKQRHVMDTVRARIESGEYPTGTRVPSIEDLARSLGYSKVTVNRALRALADQGVLVGEARARYRVTGVDRGTVPERLDAHDKQLADHGRQLEEIRRRLGLDPA